MDVPKENNPIRKTDVKLRKVKKSVVMWPVKPQRDVQSEKPAMKSSNKKSNELNKKEL